MNIKSLLIGSAAVLAASTGAKAADAIVMAEPEPMEYVRICDVYGAGFFYIPGTETCMHIGGYYRFQMNFDSTDMDWFSRFQLNVDVRSETEWGTLRGYAEGRFDYGRGTTTVVPAAAGGAVVSGGPGLVTNTYLNQGFIELITASGTLRMGKSDSPWARFLGYGTPFGPFDSQYAFRNNNEISYTFNGSNGFSAIIALVEDGDFDYMPDIQGGINFAQGWGSVGVLAAYDESDSSFAARGALRFRAANGSFSGGLLVFYSGSATNRHHIADPGAAGYNQWSATGYVRGQFTATAAAAFSAQWFSGTGGWEFTGGLDLTPVTNFRIRPEVRYRTSNSTWAAAIRFDRAIP